MRSLRAMLGHEVKEPAKPVEKLKFSAAGVERLIQLGETLYPTKNWAANKLYASNLGYTSVPLFVLQYFDHLAIKRKISANLGMSMEVGTAVHQYIQNRLMVANCLHPKSENEFYKEPRFECPEYRIVSKVDGLVDEGQLAEFSAKKFVGDIGEARPLSLDLLEIKVLNDHSYKNTKTWQDISREYRMQATATQKISGYQRTIFMIVDRGSLKFRFIVYKGEEHLWQFIQNMSVDIFKHLRNLTRPEGFEDDWLIVNGQRLSWEQWTKYHIDRQPKRKWLHLGDEKEETSFSGGFIIA